MHLSYFHVDAFAGKTFAGNPAGVCPLPAWLPDDVLQSMAAEHRLPETAFFVPRQNGGCDLRWFSPDMDIDLCGHATLAAAHVLWNHLGFKEEEVDFHTASGLLKITRTGTRIALNFPSRPAQPAEFPRDIAEAFSIAPQGCWLARDYVFLMASETEVRTVIPDFLRLTAWDAFGIVVTAPGNEVDFVSRFFAPRAGIPEDPVTGSSHCTLIPFWAERLGKPSLHARQLSKRGGELFCELRGDRVIIAGEAVTYLQGTITL